MAEMSDIVDKLEDTIELVLKRIHDLSENPVTSEELEMVERIGRVLRMVRNALLECEV